MLQSIEYNKKDNFYYIALLSAPVLLTIYRYFFEAQDFMVYFPSLQTMEQGEVYAYILEHASFFILLFIIPLLILKYFQKGEIIRQSFALPKFNRTILIGLIICFVLVVVNAYSGSSLPSVMSEYPLPRKLLSDQSMLVVYFFAYALLYYLPWEFFFRGFLLFGLDKKYGVMAAIMIQTISSSLVHIGKPMEEMVGSIPFGILTGIIAVYTRSIWYVLLLHILLGVLTDMFVIF